MILPQCLYLSSAFLDLRTKIMIFTRVLYILYVTVFHTCHTVSCLWLLLTQVVNSHPGTFSSQHAALLLSCC